MKKGGGDRPGIIRLRAMDAGPRVKRPVNIVEAYVPKPPRSPRKARKPVEAQAVLF